ncbi:T9SS type B sorting domain-containing protein [Flavobacterium sp.]|uniref:DUF7948 domain-containing protein n=1 Tax=Flavobacterium sp. TaxID=239 RepID=UPI0032674541
MKHTVLLFFLIITISLFSQNKNQSVGFKENKGQIIDQKGKSNSAVKYLLNSNGLNVQLRKNGFSYDVYEVKKNPIVRSETAKTLPYIIPKKNKETKPEYNLEYTFHRIDIDFLNSNSKVELITEQKSTDFDNYYNVPNKPEGIVGVHQYKQITYKNIYPNIDVVFTVPKDPQKTVEYNFVIHPKGKIADIQLKFNGAETDLIDNKIQMNVRFGKMEETLPASWIEDGVCKKEIVVEYRKIKKNVYGFGSDHYLNGKTIVIDPVPTRLWGTFYGDQRNNHYALIASSVTTDSSGNVYMTGTTSSSNSYATTGAHQTQLPSSIYTTSNGVIAKFNPDGNLLWGTYYGGKDYNEISDIKIDSQNNIIISGITQGETNISTPGSYKSSITGDDDAFLAKFNDSGIRLWGTYYGGENRDAAFALNIDNNNNIYIVGRTNSKTGISINNNFQTQLNLDNTNTHFDGFLAKFNINGNLVWSSYVGGELWDELKTIQVKDNFLITGGYSHSYNNIGTPGVFQEKHDLISHSDGTVYKFSLNGDRIWSSYYGGEQVDYVYAVGIDNENNIYLGGESASNNNIITLGSFESSNQSLYKGFLAKLNKDGKRIWGTYLGEAHVYSLIFKNNSIYIGATNGQSYNTKLTTLCSYRPTNTSSEGYIGKFSKEGNLIWGTYVGGMSTGRVSRIALNNDNAIFISGISYGNNGIADNTSHQSDILGTENYYLMKFSEDIFNSPIISSNSPICIGGSLELKASGGTNYLWTGPNGFTSTDQNPIITNVISSNNGEYNCLISGTGGCDGTKKTIVAIQNTSPPTGNTNQPFCSMQNPTIADIQITGDQIKWYDDSSNGSLLPATNILIDGKTYFASQTINSCESERFGVTVSIVNTPSAPIANGDTEFCKSENATLENIQIAGQNIKWYGSIIEAATLPTTTLLENNKRYYASQTIGCESDRTPVLVRINDTPLPTGNKNQPFCIDKNATIADLNITGTSLKYYDSVNNGNVLTETTLLQNSIYYITQTLNNCESEPLAITVKIQDTQIPIADSPQAFCIQKNASINDIAITGENIKWFENSTSTINLSESTPLENGITYYAYQTINNCESDRIPVLINILGATTADCINFVDELPYPKFFTPNNDTFNDTWTIDFAYLKPNTGIRIFDRYGKFIKELTTNSVWDGTYIGREEPASDYWFTVTRLNGTEYRGHFSLKR